jgi:hypothetical protein
MILAFLLLLFYGSACELLSNCLVHLGFLGEREDEVNEVKKERRSE